MKKILILIFLTINLGCFSATKSIVYNSLKYTIDTSSLTATVTGTESWDVFLYDLCIPDFVIENGTQYAVISIADQAFSSGVVRGTLTLGQNIEKIGYAAFDECDIEGTLVIPNSVTSIGREAFYGNSKITTLVIGKSVKEIGEDLSRGDVNYNMYAGYAFAGLSRLERIICLTSSAPNTWNVGWWDSTSRPNFTYYNVKLYLPREFSGDGSCSFYRSGNGTAKSQGEWSKFTNKYILEDSEFAGYLDGTYGNEEGNGNDNPGSELEEKCVNLYLNKGETRDLGSILGVSNVESSDEENEKPIASTWSTSDENIVQVSEEGKCVAVDFGTALISAFDTEGEKLGSLKIYVSPIISVEYSDGRIYKHNVIYNSHPTLYFEIPENSKITGITHDGEDITEVVLSNQGSYMTLEPITENSTITVTLESTAIPGDLNGDGKVDSADLNWLLEQMMNY